MESLKKTPFSEVDATLEVLGKHGVTSEGLKALRKNPDLAAKVALFIMAGLRMIFRVTVDNTMSLSEMIKACNCDSNNPDINSHNFKIDRYGKQAVDLVLVTIEDVLDWLIAEEKATKKQIAEKWVTKKQVFAYFASHGLMPALIAHLLALGATNPELQKQLLIIAFGSSFVRDGDTHLCPSLGCDDDGDKRQLDLAWGHNVSWESPYCRFLAVVM